MPGYQFASLELNSLKTFPTSVPEKKKKKKKHNLEINGIFFNVFVKQFSAWKYCVHDAYRISCMRNFVTIFYLRRRLPSEIRIT